MTNRNFYEMVANGTMNEEVQEHAQAQLAKMDATNAKRKEKPSKTALANEPIKMAIMEFITRRGETCIASAVAEAVEISVQKASSLLNQLTEEGKLTKSEVKVPKKGMQKAYSLVTE